jgi:hypothetical protein
MHPELLSALATEHNRDLSAAMTARRTPRPRAARRAYAARRLLTLPRFRVSWTHTTLAAMPGSRSGGSVLIVISATRPS